jgi:PBS lyase HEAT-like repeat
MIEIAAAEGLAELQDKESIPLIIQACERAPAEAAGVIAQSLVYFDDPEAQGAVDRYIPKDRSKILREARAQGKKTPWSY